MIWIKDLTQNTCILINMSLRSFHRLIAKISIAAVFFTQLAVAAYACSALSGPDNTIPAAMAHELPAAMPGCEKLDAGNPNLCLQHCQAGSQSVQSSPPLPVPVIALVNFVNIDHIQQVIGLGIIVLSALMERETSPPPLVLFGFLRI